MGDPTPTNPLGMKSISEVMTKSPTELWAETMKKATSHDWVFEKAWEKLILMAMTLWSAWSIGHWIWSLF